MVFFAFHHYLATNFHLNSFLFIYFAGNYISVLLLLLEIMYQYILFQIFRKLLLLLFFANVYAMQERSRSISHLQS